MHSSLVAIPIFNEASTLGAVLTELYSCYGGDVLLIDDGSSDGSIDLVRSQLSEKTDIISHKENRGYGASLQSAFMWAKKNAYEVLITMDCDWQHEPRHISKFLEKFKNADVLSGSRYKNCAEIKEGVPEDRYRINREITEMINDETSLAITDAFCGFKAYSKTAIDVLTFTEPGYGSPLEMWAKIIRFGLSVREISVPLIYLDAKSSFGGNLDNSEERKAYYIKIWNKFRSQEFSKK